MWHRVLVQQRVEVFTDWTQVHWTGLETCRGGTYVDLASLFTGRGAVSGCCAYTAQGRPVRTHSELLFRDTIYPRDCNYFFNIFSTGYNLSLFRVMLWFCRIASYPCPRPQTLNSSGFYKIQFICQHSLQVFILINQSSIIFTKDCREILKNPFIIIYEEMPPWSREYCLQYFITHPSLPTRCWKLGGPKRGADPRVHVGGWDKLRQQRGQITMSWQRGPGYPSQFKRASVGVMWEWGLQSWSNFIRDIVDRHYRNQGKRQCRQGGESTERLVLTFVPPPSCEGRGAARKGALCASDFTQKAFSHPVHSAYLPSY